MIPDFSNRPCPFPTCVAVAREGHEFCSVHDPRAVLARARSLVVICFDIFILGRKRRGHFVKLRDLILSRLDGTL